MTKCAFFLSILSLLAYVGLMSCDNAATPAKQPNVVKQKITAQGAPNEQVTGKTPTENAIEKTGIENDGAAQSKNNDGAADMRPVLNQEAGQTVSSYDPKGRFDPFEPLFRDEPVPEVRVAGKEMRQRRVPQTPLERVALSQLKLSAIIQAPSGNRGLVVDATGKGYIVENGTYIGLNSGKVTRIDKDRIVIEEDIEDIMGELKSQHSELKLQKPAGEL